MPSGGHIGLVFDKHAPGIRTAREIPTVAIRAVVKLSDIHGRVLFGGIGGEAASFFGKGRSPRSSNKTQLPRLLNTN